MTKPTIAQGPYTLWINHGYEGWAPTDYPTLADALQAEKHYSDWRITKPAKYVVTDVTPEDGS